MISTLNFIANSVRKSPCGNALAALVQRYSPRKVLGYSLRAAQVGLRLAQAQQDRSAFAISTLTGH